MPSSALRGPLVCAVRAVCGDCGGFFRSGASWTLPDAALPVFGARFASQAPLPTPSPVLCVSVIACCPPQSTCGVGCPWVWPLCGGSARGAMRGRLLICMQERRRPRPSTVLRVCARGPQTLSLSPSLPFTARRPSALYARGEDQCVSFCVVVALPPLSPDRMPGALLCWRPPDGPSALSCPAPRTLWLTTAVLVTFPNSSLKNTAPLC